MTDWRSEKLKDKPTTTTNNDFLDDIYATASPYESRSIFKIAFFTDFDVDLNYHEGTPHINCYYKIQGDCGMFASNIRV